MIVSVRDGSKHNFESLKLESEALWGIKIRDADFVNFFIKNFSETKNSAKCFQSANSQNQVVIKNHLKKTR